MPAERFGADQGGLSAEGSSGPDLAETAFDTRSFGLSELTAGTVIGSYHLLQRIGQGGMGEVWLAEQKQPVRRRVAVKLIKAGMDTREVVARFESERQALALMDHPGIAKVFDAGSTPQGRPYFVMEYVTGISITAYCDRHKLSMRQRLELFICVCEAVQHAHQKAIVHRDLKPSNILVGEVDGKPAPRVIDFGVAKATSQRLTADTMYTRVGTIIGTPGYMSPEQADSAGADVDTRTDVYSLGVVLYELLVGALPLDFSKSAPDEFQRRIRDEDAPRPSTRLRTLAQQSAVTAENRGADAPTLARQLRGDLDAITLKALEKDRSRRYASPAELAADIARYLRNEPVVAQPASTLYRARKYIRRHRVGVGLALAAAVMLISFAVIQTLELQRTRRERDRADRVTQFMAGMFKVSDPSEARGNDIRAREILDKASANIETGLAKEPELQAQMMHLMGTVYESLGLYPKAESLLRRAVDIRRRTLGASNAQTLDSMSELVTVLYDESRPAEAEKWTREIIDKRRSTLGPENRDTLDSMAQLGTLLNDQGHYAAAEKIHREVVGIAARVFGPQDKLTLKTTKVLAIDLAYEGKYAESEKAFREVLDADRRRYGNDHPNVLGDMNNLAASLQQQRKFDEAAALYTNMIEIGKRVLGPEHPTTLMAMGNLALVYSAGKHYPEAEKLFRETLAVKRRVLGLQHRSTLATTGNLADVLQSEGRYAEAEQLTRQNLETEKRILGPLHSDTLATVQVLGEVLRGEKRYSEAEKAFREEFDGRLRALGPSHPDTAEAAFYLGRILALEEKRDEAFSHLQFAVEHGISADDRLELQTSADFKTLRSDPRFDALLSSAKQTTGKPAN